MVRDGKQNFIVLLTLLVMSCFTLNQEAYANYGQATQLFARKDFVRAAGAFFQAYSFPKSAAIKAKAEWGLAESLRMSNMLYSSSKYYSLIIRRGPKGSNPFFQKALEALGNVDSTLRIGQSHIVKLFKYNLRTSSVPGPARGFYFYYLGIEAFNRNQFEKSLKYFKRVPSSSRYSVGALFHLGVVSNLGGKHSRAISYFESVISSRSSVTSELREMAIMNIARIHYETGKYLQSVKFYSKIPRGANSWLDAIWESSWAFYIMQKHNEALGNIHTIHSPFYYYRFYPESYILQAITFLRLCRYDQVRESLARFRKRYKNVFGSVKNMLGKYKRDSVGFFKTVAKYRSRSLGGFKDAWAILDKLSRTDTFREATTTIRNSDREMALLSRYASYWKGSGMVSELKSFLTKKKTIAVNDSGKRLYNQATEYYGFLKELSDQTGLIQAEMLEGKIDSLRSQINIKGNSYKRVEFSGGMQQLDVERRYEFWPFEGEYWEDELGYYVYNIGNKCRKGKK